MNISCKFVACKDKTLERTIRSLMKDAVEVFFQYTGSFFGAHDFIIANVFYDYSICTADTIHKPAKQSIILKSVVEINTWWLKRERRLLTLSV